MKFKSIKEFNESNQNWDLMFYDGLGYSKEETEFLMINIDEKIKEINENEENCLKKFTLEFNSNIYDIYMMQNHTFIINKRKSLFAILCLIPLGYVKRIPICEESIEDDLSSFRRLSMDQYSYHSFLLYSVMKGVQTNNRLSRLYSYQDKNNKNIVKVFETEVIKYKDYEDRDLYIARIQISVLDTKENTNNKIDTTCLVLRPFNDSKIIREMENEKIFYPV